MPHPEDVVPPIITKKVSLIVQVYLREALEVIDAELGQGAARANPALVAAFVTACGNIHQAKVLTDDGV